MGRGTSPGTRRAREGAARSGDGYHHGNLREALLQAALAILSTEGVEALTLRKAARRAGVSQAAPYHHFADKESLLAAVAEEGFRALAQAMRAAREAAGPAEVDQLRAGGRAYVEFATSHRAHFILMFGRETADRSAHPGLRAAARVSFDMLVESIRAGQRAGLVREGDPEALAVGAWSMVHGFAALAVNQQSTLSAPSVMQFAPDVMLTLWVGLRRE